MSLMAWLPLNGNIDNKGCSSGTASTSSATYTAGKIGQCYTGADLTFSAGNIFGKVWSFCFWGYVIGSQITGNWTLIARLHDGGSNLRIEVCPSSYSSGQYCYSTHNNANYNITTGSIASPTGGYYDKWAHFCLTSDGTTISKYMNGTLIGTCVYNGTGQFNGTFYLANNNKIYKNDVRLYNHCLSPAEVHEIAQGLVLHYKLNDITNGVWDSSGYGHHGTIINTVTLDSNTPRYTNSLNFNENADSITVSPYLSANQTLDAITISCWFKTSTMNSTAPNIFSLGENAFLRCRLGATNAIWSYYRVVSTQCANTYSCKTLTDNIWHLLTFTFNKGTQVVYIDGEQIGTANNSGTGTYLTCASTAWHLAGYTANSENFIGSLSDFRIYCTALSAEDVKALYNVGAKVDNKGSFHTYEFNENGSNKLKKTGVFYDYAVEPYLILSDGSLWQMLLFHYVNNGTNQFTSSNASYNNGFGLYSRLRDIDNFKYGDKYEFLAIQDDTQHRWTQTSAPLTTTSVAGFTKVSGSPTGGLCKCSGNTLLAISNSTGNWWNACGCWTNFNNGLPGFNGTTVKRYLALYARIDKIDNHIASGSIYSNNLIEL